MDKKLVVGIAFILIIACVGTYLIIPSETVCPACHGNTTYTCGACEGDGYIGPGDEGYMGLWNLWGLLK